MRVLAFGIYSRDPAYPRFNNLLCGLEENGVEVLECRHALGGSFAERMASVKTAGGAARFAAGLLWSYISLAVKFLRAPSASAILVGYPGYFHVHLARFLRLFRNRQAPIVYDVFFSLHDTLVNDRRLLRPESLAARAVRFLDRSSLRQADLVLVDTESHGRFLAGLFGLPGKKVAAVPVGSTFPPFDRPAEARAKSKTFCVVFVGTFIPLHGVDVILDAASLLKVQDGIRFTLAGSGQIRDRMERRAAEGGLSNVEFHDWVPSGELGGFLRSFDAALGVFGTTAKAGNVIPIKVFDICAAGVSLVTADTPAIREQFTDGTNALLVPPGDPAALAAAILRLRDDADMRRALAAGAHRLASERFTRRAIGRRLCEILGAWREI